MKKQHSRAKRRAAMLAQIKRRIGWKQAPKIFFDAASGDVPDTSRRSGNWLAAAIAFTALGRGEALGWRPALDNLLADHPRSRGAGCRPHPQRSGPSWPRHPPVGRLSPASSRSTTRRRSLKRAPRSACLRGLFDSATGRHSGTPATAAVCSRSSARSSALPPVPEIEQQLHDQRPDLVLITPLVYLGSSQLKSCGSGLGLRTAFCVGSWDHLSSKALIRDMPHRVIVWNETQKQEAVQLHRAGRSRHRHRRPML